MKKGVIIITVIVVIGIIAYLLYKKKKKENNKIPEIKLSDTIDKNLNDERGGTISEEDIAETIPNAQVPANINLPNGVTIPGSVNGEIIVNVFIDGNNEFYYVETEEGNVYKIVNGAIDTSKKYSVDSNGNLQNTMDFKIDMSNTANSQNSQNNSFVPQEQIRRGRPAPINLAV
jgi:cbb3-type cytochrome oxidase subunit 3